VKISGGAPQSFAWGGYYEMPIAWSGDGKSLFMGKMGFHGRDRARRHRERGADAVVRRWRRPTAPA
jgi:hypothetical protein